MRVLILGCGYLGLRLGHELVRHGHRVWGMRRNQLAEPETSSAGINLVVGDIVAEPESLVELPSPFDWVIFSASASGGDLGEYRRVYLQGLKNTIAWLAAAPPRKLIYTSSTSVYGQTNGQLVDENSATDPVAETARVLVQAEKALLTEAKPKGIPVTILRLAGIYGPGRGYWFKQYLEGKAEIEGDGQRILNMIHRDDAARAVIAALSLGQAERIYNVVDNEPVTQLACFEWLCAQLGRERPPAVQVNPSAIRKRGSTNKRVSNYRLRAELECELKFPTFREGFEEELRRLGFNLK